MNLTLRLVRKLVLRDVLTTPGRTLITVLGIALGVSVFLAISIANTTALLKFKQTVDDIAGKANIELRPSAGRYLDQELLPDLRWLWLMDGKFTPMIRADVVIDGDTPQVVQLVGIDILADFDFGWRTNTEGTVYGAAPENGAKDQQGSREDASVFASDGVYIGDKLAGELAAAGNLSKKRGNDAVGAQRDGDVRPGDRISVNVDDRNVDFTVSGILPDKGLGGAYSGRLLIADLSLAQHILQIGPKVSQVEIIVPPDKIDEAIEKLKADLPSGVMVERSSQRNEKVEKMTKSFEYNLWALTLIALVVGMFLIYNTMMISVIRRRADIGTLRALGVSKTQVFLLMMSEALFFGFVGSSLGVACGFAMADWSLQAVAQTYQRLYFNIPLESTTVEPLTLVASLAIGITFTLIAAFPPALEAASVAPAEATRRQSLEHKAQQYAGKLALGGVFVLVTAAYCSTLPAIDNLPLFGYLSAFLCVVGFALIMPVFLSACLPPLAIVCKKLFKLEGKMAVMTMQGSLGRVSVAVASLMVGIAMMASLAIMIGSFRQTVSAWVDQTFVADLWIQPSARSNGSRGATFPTNPDKAVLEVEGVKAVAPWTEIPVEVDGKPAHFAGANFSVMGKFGNLSFLSGRPSSDVCNQITDKSCIISESFAIKRNIKPGDTITVVTEAGKLSVKVIDIYYDYASDAGYIVVPRQLFIEYSGLEGVSSLSVFLKEGADPETVRSRIIAHFSPHSLVRVATTGELRRAVFDVFDKTFAITYALHTIAIAVAILSIMNALFALAYESRRDLGILKYLGMSAKKLRNVLLIDAGIMGLVGSVSGMILGYVLALLLIYVINKQSFGWTVKFSLPSDFLIESFILVMITAVASGIIPARMVAYRTPAPETVRQE